MKYLINYLSVLAGRSFAKAYDKNPKSFSTWKKLERYKSLRRRLPKVVEGSANWKYSYNHYGNQKSKGYKPWMATQGF